MAVKKSLAEAVLRLLSALQAAAGSEDSSSGTRETAGHRPVISFAQWTSLDVAKQHLTFRSSLNQADDQEQVQTAHIMQTFYKVSQVCFGSVSLALSESILMADRSNQPVLLLLASALHLLCGAQSVETKDERMRPWLCPRRDIQHARIYPFSNSLDASRRQRADVVMRCVSLGSFEVNTHAQANTPLSVMANHFLRWERLQKGLTRVKQGHELNTS
ncbi:hypothetical protein QQF64_032835 [Cirrhinus molitorella]|uniref:Uncharacterized protein n=1 Tax=Cirrhinus molitorella TaxID=172907 RepID=A0ABR3MSB6_9TELE